MSTPKITKYHNDPMDHKEVISVLNPEKYSSFDANYLLKFHSRLLQPQNNLLDSSKWTEILSIDSFLVKEDDKVSKVNIKTTVGESADTTELVSLSKLTESIKLESDIKGYNSEVSFSVNGRNQYNEIQSLNEKKINHGSNLFSNLHQGKTLTDLTSTTARIEYQDPTNRKTYRTIKSQPGSSITISDITASGKTTTTLYGLHKESYYLINSEYQMKIFVSNTNRNYTLETDDKNSPSKIKLYEKDKLILEINKS